jgi:hypothetical protein
MIARVEAIAERYVVRPSRSAAACRRWIVVALGLTASGASAQDACHVVPPVALVEAQSIYSDRAGSHLEASAVLRNNELVLSLRTFTTEFARRVDGGSADDLRCADRMLQAWATSGALLRQPTSFAAIRERQRFGLGITVAAAKLRANGGRLSDASVSWLHALDVAIMEDFERRKTIDNLAVWSASNAAALALVDSDADAVRYETDLWSAGLQQVGPDGWVPSELRRQSRALIYHQYYASALLFLRQLRIALGQPTTAAETAVLQRLIDRVEDALCDPSAMARAAGNIPQEPPPADGYRVGLAFGRDLIDQRWNRCGLHPPDMLDATLGGRLEDMREFIRTR